jgi:hypothetical protein
VGHPRTWQEAGEPNQGNGDACVKKGNEEKKKTTTTTTIHPASKRLALGVSLRADYTL